jgi:hypothetical protein
VEKELDKLMFAIQEASDWRDSDLLLWFRITYVHVMRPVKNCGLADGYYNEKGQLDNKR